MSYEWDFSWIWRNGDVLLKGMGVTALLTIATVASGTVVAVALSFMRLSKILVVQWVARIYIELFRNLPVLVTLVWLYFCLPIFMGEGLRIPPFWVAVMGLALNYSAMQAEIYRAGVEAIPVGEIEVARAFRFKPWDIARTIILPQAFWRSLAPTLGQIVNTLKFSALASYITVAEAFYVTGQLIQETFRPLEFYTALAGMYLLLIMPLSIAMQLMEKKLQVRYART